MRNNKNNILVDFHMIFDTDLAILKYIIDRYPRSKYLEEGRSEATDYFLQYLLYERTEKNPLTVLIKKEYDVDNLYKEIIDTCYEEILDKYTKPTSIYYFLNSFAIPNGYNITINCSSTLEQNRCEKESNTTYYNYKIDVKDLKNYFCIYQEYSKDLLNYKTITGKSIYLCDYGPNYTTDDEGNRVPDIIAELLIKTNEVKFINKYARFELPE